eukprot:1287339-Rhodomonas_salina.2
MSWRLYNTRRACHTRRAVLTWATLIPGHGGCELSTSKPGYAREVPVPRSSYAMSGTGIRCAVTCLCGTQIGNAATPAVLRWAILRPVVVCGTEMAMLLPGWGRDGSMMTHVRPYPPRRVRCDVRY